MARPVLVRPAPPAHPSSPNGSDLYLIPSILSVPVRQHLAGMGTKLVCGRRELASRTSFVVVDLYLLTHLVMRFAEATMFPSQVIR